MADTSFLACEMIGAVTLTQSSIPGPDFQNGCCLPDWPPAFHTPVLFSESCLLLQMMVL